MRVLLANHHTPYLHNLATALDDVEFFALPTPHAPDGWRDDQRPIPPNLHVTDTPAGIAPDVWIIQTDNDAELEAWAKGYVALSHNRPEFEAPLMHRTMQVVGGASNGAAVSISPLKTEAWQKALVEEYGSTHKQWHTILPGIDASRYGGWTGAGGYVLTVANLIRRPLFDLPAWLEATRDLPVKLVGELNETIPGAVGLAKDWGELKRYYREATCYLSVNKWPHEDGYNLSLLEAMATGTPSVVARNNTAPHDGVLSGGTDLRGTVEAVLRSPGHRTRLTVEGRESVRWRFPLDGFAASWRCVLDQVTRG